MAFSRRALPLLSASLLVPLLVHAASQTGQIQVSVTIVGECEVITPQALSFGQLGATFATKAAQSQINVNCSANTPYTIALNNGQNGNNATDRKLKSGTELLPYGLFSNAGHTEVWGDGTSGSRVVSGTGTGGSQTITVYGQLKKPQSNPKPGTYADTVTATLIY